MKTMKKQSRMWLHLLCSIILLAGLTACSSSEGDGGENEMPKPEIPVNDNDWQTVPASGGTIEMEDITISFPSGTFSEDTKVAVSEAKASDVVGDNARSKFYQVILPANGTLKPFTIKVKCEGSTEGVDMIARMPGWNTETGITALNNFHLACSASGDFVTTSIPLMRSDGQEQPFFTIGLANGKLDTDNDASEASTRTTATYKYRLKWDDLNLQRRYRVLSSDKSMENLLYVNIEKASKVLQDLKFELPEDEIPYVFRDNLGATWGNWVTSKWSRIGEIELNVKYFYNLSQDVTNKELTKELQMTLVHESTHAIQGMVYDPRWIPSLKNLSELYGEDWSAASEAIGSWSEKMIDGVHIGPNSTSKEGKANVRLFMKGFFPRYWTGTTYNKHGYGMGVFIEYLASKAGKENIVELYKSQKDGKSFMDALKNFLSVHKIDFFSTKDYYKFAFKVLNGELESLISYSTISNDYKITEKESNLTIKDTTFNYGVTVSELFFHHTFLKKGTNKSIKISESKTGVKTYVYLVNDKTHTLTQQGEITKDTPYSISVDELCKKYGVDDISNFSNFLELVLVSTREKNYEYTNNLIDRAVSVFTLTEETGSLTEISIELTEEEDDGNASVRPDNVRIVAAGSTELVTIDKGNYKYCGVDPVPSAYDSWLSVMFDADRNDVAITALPNNTNEEREGTIYCWVSNKEYPSDAEKKLLPVTVIQEAGNGEETLLDVTDLVFPVEGGAKTIKYSFGEYQWMSRDWDDDTWLRTSWSKDYLSAIAYNPTNDNRFANELYVCAFPNETGVERTQKIRFGYTNEKGQDFDKRKIYTVNVLQEGGAFNLDMMKNLFVGTWYTPQDLIYTNGDYYHRRYTFRADNTFVFEGQTTSSTSKPASWVVEATGTYSVRDYKVGGDRVSIHIEIPVPGEGIYYLALIEVFPHYLFFAYENTDGSLRHSVYMERE